MEYNFPIEEAKGIIRKVNEDIAFLASDFMVYTQAKKLTNPLNEKDMTLQVLLIDGLWATQLFREEGVAQSIIGRINNDIKKIQKTISNLSKNDLSENPDKVYKAAEELFPIILKSGKRQHYSFTSKFFHWCTRNHFPIVDSRARKNINRFQQGHELTHDLVRKNPTAMPYLQEYRRWVYFYSDLLNSLSEKDNILLRKIDIETQRNTNAEFVCEHSILRILDKVFYGGMKNSGGISRRGPDKK